MGNVMINRAFPDYDHATLPPIPSTWEDISYQHDTCPSWRVGGFQVFIDYEDNEERETQGVRFFVNDIETGDGLLLTDNWQEILEFVK